MALLDTMGVVSILPFVAILSNSDLIETNNILDKIFKISSNFGVQTNQEFLFFLGFFVFIILVLSLSFKALTIYTQTQFVYMREYSIGKRFIEGYFIIDNFRQKKFILPKNDLQNKYEINNLKN
jgi:hypothetical protein